MADPAPVPFIPSQDGGRLAVALRSTQWTLDELAHHLPAGRCTPEQLRGLATMLRQLATHLDGVAGVVPGEVDDTGR